jgi:outer membrane lipoprotein carrier protein
MKWFWFLAGFAMALTPEEALQKSALFYRSGENISFSFKVDIEYEVTGETAQYEGSVLVAGKDNFILKTPTLEVYSDGVNMWEYRPKAKQVLIKSLLDLENSLHPSDILFKYLECKPLVVTKSPQGLVLSLDPKGKIKALENMKVWLKLSTFEPTRLETIDVSGNKSVYSLKKIKKNIKIALNHFEFITPKGIEEIDMR